MRADADRVQHRTKRASKDHIDSRRISCLAAQSERSVLKLETRAWLGPAIRPTSLDPPVAGLSPLLLLFSCSLVVCLLLLVAICYDRERESRLYTKACVVARRPIVAAGTTLSKPRSC